MTIKLCNISTFLILVWAIGVFDTLTSFRLRHVWIVDELPITALSSTRESIRDNIPGHSCQNK